MTNAYSQFKDLFDLSNKSTKMWAPNHPFDMQSQLAKNNTSLTYRLPFEILKKDAGYNS